MKKIFSLLIAVVMIAMFITGCNQTTATCEILSENISNRLDKLAMAVTKLDTISNEYIASPDIFPATTTVSLIVPNPNNNIQEENINETEFHSEIIQNRIADNKNNTSDLVKNILINKLTQNLKHDANGNCYICGNNYGDYDNNLCNNCNNSIICDKYGNCINCNKQLIIDGNGNCTNCNKSCTTGNCNNINYSSFNNASNSCANALRNQLETNNDLSANNISLVEPLDTDDVTIDNNDNTNINNTANASEKYIETNLDELDNDTADNNTNRNKIYYYYEEQSFSPENLQYQPRFITNNQMQNAESNLNNYVIKIQKLYAMTADVIEANNQLQEFKNNVINSINNTRAVNDNYKNITTNPNAYQAQAIKNYLQDLDTTTKHLRNANGSLNNEVNNINRTNNLGVSNSVDVMNSNYLRILNHLDTRITYHELALSTLDQLRVLLLETINNQPVTEPDQPIVDTPASTEDNNTEDVVTDNNDYDVTVDDSDDNYNTNIDNTDNDIVNNNIIDDNNNTEIVNNDLNNTTDDKYININNENTDDSIVNTPDTTDIDNTTNDPKNDINLDDNANNIDSYETTDNTYNTDNTTTASDQNDINNEDNNSGLFNIRPNIDTYRDNLNSNEINNNIYNDNNLNDANNNDNMLNNNNNLNNNDNILDNNQAYNNSDANDSYNNFNNNEVNRKNNVINENNLNTDGNVANEINYQYDENGNLYNYNMNTNNSGTHNNINTYEYNTLLDSLNQGIVDNGINNL